MKIFSTRIGLVALVLLGLSVTAVAYEHEQDIVYGSLLSKIKSS